MKYNIAVAGVTGMVGKKMLEILQEKKIPIKNLYIYASERSAGKVVLFNNFPYEVLELTEENIKNKKIDYALFSLEAHLSKLFAPLFVEAGAIVIDNSSAFRMEERVPLVVPEVNMNAVKDKHKIIANPNCSTIQAVAALAPLHKKFKVKRVIYSTYQAVSGAGQQGYNDLQDGEQGLPPVKFPYPIYNNLLPHIDSFTSDGYTKEEHKMISETRKILAEPNLAVTATAVRVPVKNCHSISMNVQFEKTVTRESVKKELANTKGIVVLDEPEKNIYPMPITADGKDEVFAGRIRLDASAPNTIDFWVVADNIRKGAATNAVQILEGLIQRRNI